MNMTNMSGIHLKTIVEGNTPSFFVEFTTNKTGRFAFTCRGVAAAGADAK